MGQQVRPTGRELVMRDEDFIVSKTDLTGKITYANRIFVEFSRYSEEELLGTQHNIIRHPDMPRCVFQLLWDRIQAGREIFAYVKNLSKDGSHYWVFANVTPTFDVHGQIVGYYSVRRKPGRVAIREIEGLYRNLRAIEMEHRPREGLERSQEALAATLAAAGLEYDEFIHGFEASLATASP